MNSHPAVTIFPVMSTVEYTAIKNDIKARGVTEAVWMWNGTLLDGRHRARACEELGISCPTREWSGTEDEVLPFVISLNLKRRHLNGSQLAMVAAKISNLSKGSNQHRPIGPSSAEIALSQATAAAMVGAKERSTKRASSVLKQGVAELIDGVSDGSVPVSVAAEIAKQPKSKQAKATKDAKAHKPKKPKPAPDPLPPDLADALVHADKEIRAQQSLIDSLNESDLGKEVQKWHLMFDQLEGRLQLAITQKNEADKQARYSSGLLAKIRKVLGVEKNSEIIPAIQSK